jgi:coniferyl-aldehyde dehydrogenase
MDATDTPLEELPQRLAVLRAQAERAQRSYAERREDLYDLRAALKLNLPELARAMDADFGGRSRHESLISDGMAVLAEIDHLISNLKRWMRPKRRWVSPLFWPGSAEVRPQALGVVGVISPWNYPVNLALVPLATALAAGNAVYLKPSEHTPRTSAALRDLLRSIYPRNRVEIALGGADVAAAFAALPFDHLFFTGSTAVGRKVMAAAAPNLTPVTLELGGKSPVILAPGYPIERAAARIASGKFLNAGQTCIAPDYLLVPEDAVEPLVSALREEARERYPDIALGADYTRIVNRGQYQRLRDWREEAEASGARVLPLLEVDPELADTQRLLPPTLVLDAPESCRLMQEEIFGPLLPIVTYKRFEDAIAYVKRRDRPLALYLFDHDRGRVTEVLERTIAGSVAINDTVLQFAQTHLPFGGVGPSGMGAYHGEAGFRTFSLEKPVFRQGRWSGMSLFVPPYRKLADVLVRWLTR